MVVKHLGANRVLGSSTEGATDTLGTTGDATSNDSALVTSGHKLGTGCLDFDGSEKIVATSGLQNAMDTAGSISMWFNADQEEDSILIAFCQTNANTKMEVTTRPNRKLGAQLKIGGTQKWEVTSDTLYNGNGNWNHVVLTHNGTLAEIYINGSLATMTRGNTNDNSLWWTGLRNTGANGIAIGSKAPLNGASHNEFFEGKLDDIGIWNRALTSDEVGDLYGDGTTTMAKATTIPSGLKVYYSCDSATVTNEAVIVDEKATITDVPLGTRYEETDTRKIFRRKGAGISVTGLKAYFTMGEASGDIINRASEYGSTDAIANFDLSVTGATQNVNGKYNKCVSFSGNQWAEASDSNLTDTNFLSQNGAAWTICYWTAVEGLASGGNIEGDQGWFSTRGTGGQGVFVRVAATVAPPNNMAHTSMVIGTNGTDKFSGNTTANGLEDLSSPTGWHFVVVQYNDATNTGRDMKDNSGTWNNITYEQGSPNMTNTDTPSAKFRLAQTASDNNRLNGDMEAVSIWNRILTAAELTSLYTSTEVGQGLAPSWVEKGTA